MIRPALFLAPVLLAVALLAAVPADAGEPIPVAPHPVAVAVQDRDGRTVDPLSLGGRLTLLHFWATWCGTCRTEFPAIDALQRDLGADGIRVAAVSLDRLGWPVIDRTLTDLGIRDVTVLHDLNREAATTLALPGLPTTVIVDARGREIARIIGAGAWSDPGLRAKLKAWAAE